MIRIVRQSETSLEAFDSVKSKITRSQDDVLFALRLFPEGTTDTELEWQMRNLALANAIPRQSPSGIRTRRAELVVKGRVEDTGKRATTTSGRKAIIWKAVR